jgi:thiamine-monophosphate kinase
LKSRPRLEPGQGARLGPGAEFDRIRAIAEVLGKHAEELGHDCGFVRIGDEYLALSTDVSVEQVHFRFEWIEPREVGWRAAAAALSDLAAVAAEPLGLLAAVTLPVTAPDAVLLELMAGIGAAADYAAAPVLGGDLSRGSGWSVAVTVLGRTSRPITRAGAEPGDRLWVTGTLGGARSALEAWRRGEQPPAESRRRFAHPEPRLEAARWLARAGAHAMIDLSDGIAGDAGHLAAASQVRVEIELARLPLSSPVAAEAARAGQHPGEFAAEGGEDYELLAAMPPEFDGASGLERECGVALTRIGSVHQGAGAGFVRNGEPIALRGFNHFG